MKNLGMVLLVGLSVNVSVSHAEDYQGSSFAEVMDILSDKNFHPRTDIEAKEFSLYQKEVLPQYPVNSKSVFAGGSAPLVRDAKRTVSERFDYYDRLPKKLHPNGVCVAGNWKITKDTPYSGYLATGSQGLFVGRISVAMEDTTSADPRGFGFAGKVFPTVNENEVVKTGNFFTVDVLMGTDLAHVLDAKTTNEPETGFRFSLIGLGLKIASALKSADENPGFRPLSQVASLGTSGAVKQPRWIRLSANSEVRRNNEADFRKEVLKALNENKVVTYSIEVSNTTKDRTAKQGWEKVGEIELNQSVVSYGCDRRLHFAHPKLK